MWKGPHPDTRMGALNVSPPHARAIRIPDEVSGIAMMPVGPMADRLPSAVEVHRAALVIDLHCDTLLEVAARTRDIRDRSSRGFIDLPRLREGGVGAQVFAAFIHPKQAARGFTRALELTNAFERMLEENPRSLGKVTGASEIVTFRREGRIGAILAIENGDALEQDLANLDRLHHRGVRMMSLTWNASNPLADGALEAVHGGLTQFGRQVVARMQELRMVIDLSHLSPQSFWDVLVIAHGPMVASHSSAAGVTPHPRNLTDAQLQAIAQLGGVVGVNFFPVFLGEPTLDRLLDHIDYLVRVMGVDHVGLGSDFDGFTGQVQGLEDVSKLPNLTAGLLARGYRQEQLLKILGGNVLRVFRDVWGQ